MKTYSATELEAIADPIDLATVDAKAILLVDPKQVNFEDFFVACRRLNLENIGIVRMRLGHCGRREPLMLLRLIEDGEVAG